MRDDTSLAVNILKCKCTDIIYDLENTENCDANEYLYHVKTANRCCAKPAFCRNVLCVPYNFAADSFHKKKLCSRLSSSKERF